MASAHVTTLKSRHAELDARIHDEERRPSPDGTLLARLKKQKLRVKEEMTQAH
ncbi:MAG: YdcH family protein [Sphingopyxis sp.]|nr:YdcH family protein [Sphingopyxis sp.]